LNANTFFANRAGVAKAPYRRNQFGGNVGGAVRKDKTFYFVDYEGTRVVQPTTIVNTIPTLAQRQMVSSASHMSAISSTGLRLIRREVLAPKLNL
jgi:hypothetical protein